MTDPICRNCQRPMSEHEVAIGTARAIRICPTAQFEAGVVDDACSECDGRGEWDGSRCAACGGTGKGP